MNKKEAFSASSFFDGVHSVNNSSQYAYMTIRATNMIRKTSAMTEPPGRLYFFPLSYNERKPEARGGRGEMKEMDVRLHRLTVDDTAAAEAAMLAIGADPRGVAIMREKAVFRVVKVEAVPLKAANLLKQTFLAKGGEAAVSRETAALTAERTDVILMATLAVYRRAIGAMRAQPFGLAAIATALENFLWENETGGRILAKDSE